MKQVKIYLSAVAFIIAIGGVFASSMMAAPAYRQLASPFRIAQTSECQLVGNCADAPAQPQCTTIINGVSTPLFKGTTFCTTVVNGNFIPN